MKSAKVTARPDTSADLDSLASELRYAGDRELIARTCAEIADHLRTLSLPDEYSDFLEIGRAAKRNFAQRLSAALAQKLSDALRPTFPGIFPDESGRGHERSDGAAALEDRVRRDRRPVDDDAHGRARCEPRARRHDGEVVVRRGRRDLAHGRATVGAPEDDVGERPADVDADPRRVVVGPHPR